MPGVLEFLPCLPTPLFKEDRSPQKVLPVEKPSPSSAITWFDPDFVLQHRFTFLKTIPTFMSLDLWGFGMPGD